MFLLSFYFGSSIIQIQPTQPSVVFVDTHPSLSLKRHTTNLPVARNNNYDFQKSRTEEFTTSPRRVSPSLSNENSNDLKDITNGNNRFSRWFK